MDKRSRRMSRAAFVGAIVMCGWFCGSARGDEPADVIGRKLSPVSLIRVGTDADPQDIPASRATVIVFIATECPMSNSYLAPLGLLADEYRDRDVQILLISANQGESPDQLAAYGREYGITLPLLRDASGAMAEKLDARVTPEAFLLDDARVVRYRGRIDDQYVSRLKRRDQPRRHDLRVAIDELLAGRPVSEPVTEALGCPIDRPSGRKVAGPIGEGSATFNRDVMPILQRRCQTCHRPGEAAPFSLMNYRQATRWHADIERVVSERAMPPWKPEAGFGEFRDEQRLSDAEIETVLAWIRSGMPEGDASDLSPPREFSAGGWTLGEPDLVLTMLEPYELYASGRDVIRQFVIPTGLAEDKWVSAVEFRPGNIRIAHHAIFFTDTTGRARQFDEMDSEPGFSRFGFIPTGGIGGWAVGTQATPLPDGVGMRLRKNSDLVLQMHYHPSGKVETDQSTVGIYFAKKPVEKHVIGIPVFGMRFSWPPNDDRIRTTGRFVLPVDTHAISVFPHMHLLGTEFKMTATRPDGSEQPLIYIKDWDFNWQQPYLFKEPLALPKGTRIDLEAYADNSLRNPNNPNDPPKTVTFGEQTTNEMCIGFVGCTVDDDREIEKLLPLRRLRQWAESVKKQ